MNSKEKHYVVQRNREKMRCNRWGRIIECLFCRQHQIYYKIGDMKYCVKYHRTVFWAYEKPTLKLFFKEKFYWWHAQVWEVLPSGSTIGFGTWMTEALFPRKQMKEFLKAEAERIYKICYTNKMIEVM